MSEKPVELPDGWCETRLETCVDILDSIRIPVNSKERADRKGNVPYYGATGQAGWIDDYIFDEEILLVGEDGAPFLDKSKPIAYIVRGKSWVNNHAHVLRAIASLTSNVFLKYFLDDFDFNDYVSGSTRLKLTQSSMKSIPVSLPPLAEQERIVTKVEIILASVDKIHTCLDHIPDILKRLRQSILAAASSGKLTENWREGHAVASVTRDDINSRIKMRKKKHPKYRQPRSADQVCPVELPWEWTWASIEELASGESRSMQSGPFGSNLLHSEFQETGILAIGIDNVQDGWFSKGSEHRISAEKYKELEKYTARPADVLITVMGTVGRVCVVPDNLETAIITKHVYRTMIDQALGLPKYVGLVLRDDSIVQPQIQGSVIGQTRPGINGRILKGIGIPLPSLEEQKEIIYRANQLFQLADKLEARYQKAKQIVDKLTQSILAKALRGELVPTEAERARQEGRSYETAEELLTRIKAERAKQPKPKRVPRKSRKTMKKTKANQQEAISVEQRLLEALAKAKGGKLAPEQLFKKSGFDEASVDEFYEGLRACIDAKQIKETRQRPKEVYLEAGAP